MLLRLEQFAKTGFILHVSMMDERVLAQKRVVLSVIVVTWCRFKLIKGDG
jgi:hypothetical protein